MHAVIATDSRSANATTPLPDEKVGLRRVRLVLSCQRLSASVGTFFAADKVLLGWATRHSGPLECAFEIVYDDGQILAGDYRFEHRATARPALMGYVRKALAALCDGSGKWTPVRGLNAGPHSFLAHYETEDFISN
jgi:hypothetical protein